MTRQEEVRGQTVTTFKPLPAQPARRGGRMLFGVARERATSMGKPEKAREWERTSQIASDLKL